MRTRLARARVAAGNSPNAVLYCAPKRPRCKNPNCSATSVTVPPARSSGSPFGGMKESGIGREHCRETLHMYSQLKAITLQNAVPAAWFAS